MYIYIYIEPNYIGISPFLSPILNLPLSGAVFALRSSEARDPSAVAGDARGAFSGGEPGAMAEDMAKNVESPDFSEIFLVLNETIMGKSFVLWFVGGFLWFLFLWIS